MEVDVHTREEHTTGGGSISATTERINVDDDGAHVVGAPEEVGISPITERGETGQHISTSNCLLTESVTVMGRNISPFPVIKRSCKIVNVLATITHRLISVADACDGLVKIATISIDGLKVGCRMRTDLHFLVVEVGRTSNFIGFAISKDTVRQKAIFRNWGRHLPDCNANCHDYVKHCWF